MEMDGHVHILSAELRDRTLKQLSSVSQPCLSYMENWKYMYAQRAMRQIGNV